MKWFKAWVFIVILIVGILLRSSQEPHPFPFLSDPKS